MNGVIFLCHDLPYPDTTGGRKISLGKILELSRDYDYVKVVCYNYKCEDFEEASNFFKKAGIQFFQYQPEKSTVRKIILIIKSMLLSSNPFYSFRMMDSAFSRFVDGVASSCSNYFLDNIFLFPALKGFLKHKKINIFIMFHNVESKFFRELSKIETRSFKRFFLFFESFKVSLLEKKIIKNVNEDESIKCFFLTDVDRRWYIDELGLRLSSAFINDNSIYMPGKVQKAVDKESPFFLFPGSIDFPPNLEGLLSIAEVFRKIGVDAKIIATGPASSSNLKKFSRYDFIKFTGLIDSDRLICLYSKCICAISPINRGGGVKVKNIEAIQLGVDIVLTKFSDIGIPESKYKHVAEEGSSCFVNKMNEIYYKKMKDIHEN